MKFKERMSGMGGALLLSAALAFLVSIYAPIELFCGSQEDFWFEIGDLLPACGVLFLSIFAGAFLILFLLRLWGKTPLAIGLAVVLTLFAGGYVQGNFLVSKLPPLDGTKVDWNADPAQCL